MAHRAFYPGDCRVQIDAFLADGSPPNNGPDALCAALVPHAGWRFSGGVAARTLQALSAASQPDVVALLGTYHRPTTHRSALYPRGTWETPLGALPVAAEAAEALLRDCPNAVEASTAAHRDEHSLEVVAPFVRALFEDVSILPILVLPDAEPLELGAGLARLADNVKMVAVASTDLTHYGSRFRFAPAGEGDAAHDWMRANDQRFLQLVCELRADAVVTEAEARSNACGPGAVAAVLEFARRRGAVRGALLEYTDSHQVTQPEAPFRMAVGYAGLVC